VILELNQLFITNVSVQWLDFFKAATNGDAHCRRVMERYSRLIAEKRAKADLNKIIREELVCFTPKLI